VQHIINHSRYEKDYQVREDGPQSRCSQKQRHVGDDEERNAENRGMIVEMAELEIEFLELPAPRPNIPMLNIAPKDEPARLAELKADLPALKAALKAARAELTHRKKKNRAS
jgi:hypothetical protein